MPTATSTDGTLLAYDRTGDGAPVVLVTGAFNDRHTGAGLAAWLAPRFTVLTWDRRGRGDSGESAPTSIAQEVEDLGAIVAAAGRPACVFGYSSGAALALEAALAGIPMRCLALYDLPPEQAPGHAAALAALVADGRRGDAVEYFQRRLVGLPEGLILQLRHAPFRPALEALAHTLASDAALVASGRRPAARLALLQVPTLAIAAGAGPSGMEAAAEALARAAPHARSLVLAGATHDLDPERVGPVLEAFLDSPSGGRDSTLGLALAVERALTPDSLGE
jgi:pimeloyl-ACP methyl ester carboxylesterase